MDNSENPDTGNYNLALAFLLMILLVGGHSYFNHTDLEESSTQWIEIELTSIPYYYEGDADSYSKITFSAKGYDREFELNGCALYSINKNAICGIPKGGTIHLQVDPVNLKSKNKSFIQNRITVYGVKLKSGRSILSLKSYNQCEKDSWKPIRYLIFIPLIMILYTFISNRRAKRK